MPPRSGHERLFQERVVDERIKAREVFSRRRVVSVWTAESQVPIPRNRVRRKPGVVEKAVQNCNFLFTAVVKPLAQYVANFIVQ
jgi:hypothetical protein